MDNEQIGIDAQFCDIRQVAGRNVAKLIFEIDMSMVDAAIERLGGFPDGEQWCRLVPFTRTDAP